MKKEKEKEMEKKEKIMKSMTTNVTKLYKIKDVIAKISIKTLNEPLFVL